MTDIIIPADSVNLSGILTIPDSSRSLVLFAHGSGSSRLSSRNQYVAQILNQAGIATLLFDLLSPEEDAVDEITREHRFNIELLSSRLLAATKWVLQQKNLQHGKLGYFGASTGAAAALKAAARIPDDIFAVVSRGGRPDLAGEALTIVRAPTLLIVGGDDGAVIEMNKDAMRQMTIEVKLEIIPGATHLFEEKGALTEVAKLAKAWFVKYL